MTIKTTLAPEAPWLVVPPKEKRKYTLSGKYRKKPKPIEVDYLREAREQLAEMINNRRTA